MTRLRTASFSFILSVFIMLGDGCNRAENELQSGLIAEPSHFYLPPDKEMTTPVFSRESKP